VADPSSSHPWVSEWLLHIRALAVGIGPRGSTRPGERQGAEYARASFTHAGLHPQWEEFRSARSYFHPHLIGCLLILAAFAIFPLWGRVTAGISALLTILSVVSELQELGLRSNLFRLLVPKAGSQNVYAVIPPKGADGGCRIRHPGLLARVVQGKDEMVGEGGKLVKKRMPASFQVSHNGNTCPPGYSGGPYHAFHSRLVHQQDPA